MATVREKKDLIGFILAAEKDKKLALGLLSQNDPQKLYEFFRGEGFTEIPRDKCDDILAAIGGAVGLSVGIQDISAAYKSY